MNRICPGKELAESTMFIAIAMIAASFDISKAKDTLGREIEPVREYSSGLLRQVLRNYIASQWDMLIW